jgi:hypothetical protein
VGIPNLPVGTATGVSVGVGSAIVVIGVGEAVGWGVASGVVDETADELDPAPTEPLFPLITTKAAAPATSTRIRPNPARISGVLDRALGGAP